MRSRSTDVAASDGNPTLKPWRGLRVVNDADAGSIVASAGGANLELAAVIEEMFKYERVAALGVASTPSGERDPDGLSREAAYNLIRAAVRGAQQRGR